MPETVPDDSIRAQKVITFIKGRDVVVYTTAYGPQQAWDAYLDCYKRFGSHVNAKVENTKDVSRELSKKAWEELQEFKGKPKTKKPAKPKKKEDPEIQ